MTSGEPFGRGSETMTGHKTWARVKTVLAAMAMGSTLGLGCDVEEPAEHIDEEGAYEPPPGGKADAVGQARYSWPLVRHGDAGANVVVAQHLLLEHGHAIELSGEFDTATELATIEFQRSAGLDDDGLIGNNTWEALITTTSPGDEDRGAVRAVQDLLSSRYGYAVEVSGRYDEVTETHVRRFQEERCLTHVDAIVGPETWNALVADISYCSRAGHVLELHAEGAIVLLNTDFGRNDGADPLANITDAAAGRPSNRSCNFAGGGRDSRLPCGEVPLDAQLIEAMIALHEDHGFRYVVTAISGARHSPNSYHYRGRAVDIGAVDGVTIRGDTAATRRMVQACVELGAVEALGPHNDSHHQTHIHCAF